VKFKKTGNPKTQRLVVRVTAEEKADIESRAADCLMPVSKFVLKAAQGRQTRTQHDLRLIEELRTIGMGLKEIYQAEQPRNATELDAVMTAIIHAIERIAEESRFKI
jgi:hypothetical protein